MDLDFYARFEEGKMEEEEWEVLFMKGKLLAKQKITFEERDEKPMDLLAPYDTPLNNNNTGSPIEFSLLSPVAGLT